MSGLAVETRHLTKTFGLTDAVKDINLQIKEGEFFSFLGPSGCGKTTLLRMIAGFETPSSGDLFVGGESVIAIPPHKRSVNMVFQSYALFPHLSVRDNIAFGLHNQKFLPKSEIPERVAAALDLVRMAQLADRMPAQLSGGQQQRVAVARAIVNRPRVLLLDEPLSALDPQIRQEMQDELSSLQKQMGLTFVMVTHDQSEALALSHQVAVFSRGNLEQVGRPQDIFDRPQTEFVAKFIGQTNLLPGAVKSVRNDYLEVELRAGCVLKAMAQPDRRLSPGEAVTVAVKPHAIRVCDPVETAIADSDNVIIGEITGTHYQGHASEAVVRLGDGSAIRAPVDAGGRAPGSCRLIFAAAATICFGAGKKPDRLDGIKQDEPVTAS